MKVCACCKLEKPIEQFSRNKPSYCKSCVNQKDKERKKRNSPDKLKAKYKRYAEKKKQNKPAIPKRSKEEILAIKRIRRNLHKRMYRWFTTKTQRSFDLLPFTREEFLCKISFIPPDHQIDHMIPVEWFTKEAPLGIVYHLDNLQVIHQKENNEKGCRYCHIPNPEYLTLAKPWLK